MAALDVGEREREAIVVEQTGEIVHVRRDPAQATEQGAEERRVEARGANERAQRAMRDVLGAHRVRDERSVERGRERRWQAEALELREREAVEAFGLRSAAARDEDRLAAARARGRDRAR